MLKRLLTTVAAVAMTILCTGCPQYRDASVPNEIRKVEISDEKEYLLYVPSTYDRRYKWPLIMLCHGTKPFDNERRQMLDWVKLAEERRFIVAAPILVGTTSFRTDHASQLKRQREDEQRILAVTKHLRAAYNISSDRIFMTGWSAGNYAVLYTGLKHPETFRALGVQQGNFDVAFMSELVQKVDPHQPVAVIYSHTDVFAGSGPRETIEWLDQNQADIHELEVSGGHRGHPKETQQFFERVIREMPWLRIRTLAVDDADALTVQFKTIGSFTPVAFSWDFGDGGDSPVAAPVHHFDQPGTYTVTLQAAINKDRIVSRSVEISVPQIDAIKAIRTTWDD